ncbi:MAG: hypothetical protein CSA95_03570, partial [Bacteroidetes bacterium]
ELLIEACSISGDYIREIARTTVTPGKHTFRWEGKDHNGNDTPRGLYLIRTTLNNKILRTIKIEKI